MLVARAPHLEATIADGRTAKVTRLEPVIYTIARVDRLGAIPRFQEPLRRGAGAKKASDGGAARRSLAPLRHPVPASLP